MTRPLTADDYLRQAYSRLVTVAGDGTLRVEIAELPGLVGSGYTVWAAIAALEAEARTWLEAEIAAGREIPEPAHVVAPKLKAEIERLRAALAEIEALPSAAAAIAKKALAEQIAAARAAGMSDG